MATTASIYARYGENINLTFRWHESLTGYRVRVIGQASGEVAAYPLGEVDGTALGTDMSIPVASAALDAGSSYVLTFQRVTTAGESPSTLSTNRGYKLKITPRDNYVDRAAFVLPSPFDDEDTFTDIHTAIRRAFVDGGSYGSFTYTTFLEDLEWLI